MKPIPSHELVGARHVGELPSADMVDLWVAVSSAIVKYGFDQHPDLGGDPSEGEAVEAQKGA